jgi:hypothetical protein
MNEKQIIGKKLSNEKKWMEKFYLCREYFLEYGNLDIFIHYKTKEGIKLGSWISMQRIKKKKGLLSEEKVKLLESIGMIWDASIKNGGTSFPEYFIYYILKEYYGEDKVFYRDKSLGFELDIYIPHLKKAFEYDGNAWHKNKENKDAKKDNKVSKKEIILYRFREPGLNNLISSNCFCLNNTSNDLIKITEELYHILSNEFGINVKYSFEKIYNEYVNNYKLNTQWDKMFICAKEYFLEYGNLEVLYNYQTKEGIKLGSWISNQREFYKKGILSSEQIELLESIGMVWYINKGKWDKMFICAKKYFLEYGNLEVPKGYITEEGINLVKWIIRQRQDYKKGKLTSEQIKALESIGILWNPYREKWDKMFSYAKEYFLEYGNLLIPQRYIIKEDINLGIWIVTQRQFYKKNKLSTEQIKQLEAIGMVWSLK